MRLAAMCIRACMFWLVSLEEITWENCCVAECNERETTMLMVLRVSAKLSKHLRLVLSLAPSVRCILVYITILNFYLDAAVGVSAAAIVDVFTCDAPNVSSIPIRGSIRCTCGKRKVNIACSKFLSTD